MKLSQIKYRRPSLKEIEKDFKALLDKFKNAKSGKEQIKIIKKVEKIQGGFISSYKIAQIRHDTNTANKKYINEKTFFDENLPIYEKLEVELSNLVNNSKYKKEIKKEVGQQFLDNSSLHAKTFKPEIVNLLKKENKLKSEYTKLTAGAKVKLKNKTLSFSELEAYMTDSDRETRKKAQELKSNFFKNNAKKFDSIFDDLVKTRHEIALKMGYKNFSELAYARMGRTKYDDKDVAVFRKQIKETAVPLTKKLKKEQTKRLKLKQLKYYDDPFNFTSGNAKPKGDSEWIVKNAIKMYDEMSPETSRFFRLMLNKELMDLNAKKNKKGGGYCTFIQNIKMPFILSNFNGTSADIDVLTHEVGHAFQFFLARNNILSDYTWSTSEISEIHSMSMEFFAWPWMENFFKNDVAKYKYSHLSTFIPFMCYAATVDEFQHYVYKNVNDSPKERSLQYRKIEKKYRPWVKYDSNKFLENGGAWQYKQHIYLYPFYYIDYALALVCALQFWKRDQKNHKEAWNSYLELCRAGGSKSFYELLKIAKLKSPFNKNTLGPIMRNAEKELGGLYKDVLRNEEN